LKKSLLGKHLDGGFEDALVFLRIFLFRDDGEPPRRTATMNEYSFIYQSPKLPVKS
jgi:hypothetical protein